MARPKRFARASSAASAASAVAVLAVGVVVLTACSSPPETPEPNTEVIESNLEQARAAGADPAQIQVLERALERGSVTFEDLNELSQLTMQCLRDAGFEIREQDPREVAPGSGLRTPNYLMIEPQDMSDDAAAVIIMECGERFDTWASTAFADQPIVVEAYNAPWDTPEIRACLEDHGHQIEEDMTGTELNALASDDWNANADVPGFEPCIPDGP